jgi:3-oxoacyl-[acyl-carrier-protein] synthase II
MPTTSRRRAVLTGFGVVSPIGSTPAAFWDALLAGTRAVRTIRSFDASASPCRVAGEVPDFVARNVLEKHYRKELKAMGRTVQFGTVAAQFAMLDAGLAKGSVPPERFGVEFASSTGTTDLDDLAGAGKVAADPVARTVDLAAWGAAAFREIPPLWMLKYLPNMPACHITILYDAQGPSNTLISTEAAGVLAFGEALRILRRDAADFMLVGGSETRIHPLCLARYTTFMNLTTRNDDPAGAVRPFDRTRDGTALGEGGCVFGLEDLGHAKKRGAKIYGEVVGFAAGVDRGLTGAGLARVIRNAVADAGISEGDVDHVNAHGSGEVELDAFEARGIGEVFGTRVPVFAPLSRFGNLGTGSGVIELAASVMALYHGRLPPTLNCDDPDPACPIAVHTGGVRPVAKPFAVKTAYTDLGQCAAVVIRKWDGEN